MALNHTNHRSGKNSTYSTTLFRRSVSLLMGSLILFAWWGCLDENAQARFNGDFSLRKHTLDAENFLDWRAYQMPYAWRHEARTALNIFRGSVGSLSQKKFYSTHDLRLEKDFAKYASFLYGQREDSFFRGDPIEQEVEIRFGKGLYGSIFGFPRHQKIEAYQGYALSLGKRSEEQFLRLSRLKQYGLYNVENEGDEFYAPNPRTYRLEGHAYWGGRVFTMIDLRREKPATLVSPSRFLQESYRGDRLDMTLDVHWSNRLVTGLRHRAHKEARERWPSAGTESRASQVLRSGWLDLYGVLSFDGGDVLEAGVYRGLFDNRIRSETSAEVFDHRLLTDAMYLVWDHARGEGARWVFSLQGGVAKLDKADGALPMEASAEESTEVKLGAGVVLEEARSHRIFFNTTWDLDLFQHRQWDGGNVQVQLLF